MANYYDSSEQVYKPIPKAKFYVLSNDKFMSGWGPARNQTNTCVVPCESLEEAERVERYVRTRAEQKYVRLAETVRAKANVVYSMCEGWKRLAAEREHVGA